MTHNLFYVMYGIVRKIDVYIRLYIAWVIVILVEFILKAFLFLDLAQAFV